MAEARNAVAFFSKVMGLLNQNYERGNLSRTRERDSQSPSKLSININITLISFRLSCYAQLFSR